MGVLHRLKTKRAARKQAKAETRREAAVAGLFDRFAGADGDEPDGETMGPNGVSGLCGAIGVDPASLDALVLCFLAGAGRMGFFTRAEFRAAMDALAVGDVDELGPALRRARTALSGEPDKYRELYSYAFRFAKDTPAKKVVDLAAATAMLDIVTAELDEPRRKATERFIHFLSTEAAPVRALNADQWDSWLDFCTTFTDPTYADWDDDGPYPLLLSDYVAYARET